MTALAPAAMMLALVQTATSLPGLFLGLPAGALADVVDRRRLLVAASGWMLAVSALLAVTTFGHLTSSWWLLGLIFGVGIGSVLALPAWQAITPELVPTGELQPAVTLSSVAVNLARAVGPAAGRQPPAPYRDHRLRHHAGRARTGAVAGALLLPASAFDWSRTHSRWRERCSSPAPRWVLGSFPPTGPSSRSCSGPASPGSRPSRRST